MSTDAMHGSDFADLARDPLTRLVMASDGVTEAAFVAVLDTARQAVEARMAMGARCAPVPRRRVLRVVPSARARRHRAKLTTNKNITMAGLVPATHAVGHVLALPERHSAGIHQPVMRSRVDTRDKPAQGD